MKFDVFISHSSQCRRIVVEICHALEARGISCWYAPRNIVSEYAQDIARAIANCRIFLLVLNDTACDSMHVKNEIDLACQRVQAKDDIVILPFKIDQNPISDAVRYYICRMHFMDGTTPPEYMRINELTERICCLLDKTNVIEKTIFIQNQQTQQYALRSSFAYPDSSFVGREKELEKIHQHLSSVQNKLILVGIGGIGKSEIAKKYMKDYGNSYEVIVWVDFQESLKKTIVSDYGIAIQGICRSDFLQEDDDAYFERKLNILKNIAGREVLFVIDNFDCVEDPDLENVLAGEYSILFTSRYHHNLSALEELTITEFEDKQDLKRLFLTEYKKTLSREDEKWIYEIIGLLNSHTLMIRLVSSAMQTRRIKIEKMYHILENNSMKEENQKAFDMIYGKLRKVFQLSSFSQEELYVMHNLALVPMLGIPVELLFDWIEMDEYEIIDELIQKNWVIHNPGSDEVHLHPLISQLIRENLQEDYLDCYVSHLLEQSDSPSLSKQECLKIDAYIDQALQIIGENSKLRMDVLLARARLDMHLTRYDKAIEEYKKIIAQLDQTKERLKNLLWAYQKVGHAYILMNYFDDGLYYVRKGLELLENQKIEELPEDIGVIYCSLRARYAQICMSKGLYDEAIESFKANKEYYINIGLLNRDYGWQDMHVSQGYLGKGDLEQALKYAQSTLEFFISENDEWSCAYAYENLARVLIQLNDFEETWKCLDKALELQLEIHGEKHGDTGRCYLLRGDAYMAQSNKEQAMNQYRKANYIFGQIGLTSLMKDIEE